MTTDKQKICKCGANMAEFLTDSRTLERYLRMAKAENSTKFTSALKTSIDTLYRDINKIEDDCGIDANKIKWSHSGMFNKIEKLETFKDPKQFNEKKEDIIRDIDSITYDVEQKVKDCSK